jgi:hypothetical protein
MQERRTDFCIIGFVEELTPAWPRLTLIAGSMPKICDQKMNDSLISPPIEPQAGQRRKSKTPQNS